MPMAKFAKKYARKGRFVLRSVADEAVLVPEEGRASDEDTVYVLNEVAAAIWQLIEPGHSAEDIGRRIADEFDVNIEKASEDVAAFLILLAEKGLIEEL